MTSLPIRQQLLKAFDKLTPEKQRQLLAFTQGLDHGLPSGTPTEVLLAHMGGFVFEPGELACMAQVIEEAFETGDLNE